MTESYIQWPSVPSGSGPTAQGSGQLGKGAEGAKNPWVRTGYHKWKRTGKPLILATWNVRTLLDRVGANRPERRTALVTRELKQYNVDIAALSETRFLDKGVLSEVGSGYTIFWSGRKSERKAGVGFAVRTSLVSQLESQPKGINDRIMTMRLPLQDNRNATLISVFAPTMTNPDDIKEVFYQQLDVIVRSVPTADRLIILGDLNARIGSNHTAWTGIIGHHGIGQENSKNWAKFRDEVNSAARETIDVLKKHHQDWFDDNDTEIQGLLPEKYTAHKAWLADNQTRKGTGFSLSQG